MKAYSIVKSTLALSLLWLAGNNSAMASPSCAVGLSNKGLVQQINSCSDEKMKEQVVSMAVMYILAAKAKVNSPDEDSKSNAVRYIKANRLMTQNKFADLQDCLSQWLNQSEDLDDTLALADIAIRVGDMDGAFLAYEKANKLPGGAEAATRGFGTITWTKQQSKNYMVAAEVRSNEGHITEAIDELNNALSIDPKNAELRLMMADTLVKGPNKNASTLRAAANHYRAFLALKPETNKKKKIDKTIALLESKASKSEQKLIAGKQNIN